MCVCGYLFLLAPFICSKINNQLTAWFRVPLKSSRRETLFKPIQDFDVQGLVGSGLDDAAGGKQGNGIPLDRHAGISEGEAEVVLVLVLLLNSFSARRTPTDLPAKGVVMVTM